MSSHRGPPRPQNRPPASQSFQHLYQHARPGRARPPALIPRTSQQRAGAMISANVKSEPTDNHMPPAPPPRPTQPAPKAPYRHPSGTQPGGAGVGGQNQPSQQQHRHNQQQQQQQTAASQGYAPPPRQPNNSAAGRPPAPPSGTFVGTQQQQQQRGASLTAKLPMQNGTEAVDGKPEVKTTTAVVQRDDKKGSGVGVGTGLTAPFMARSGEQEITFSELEAAFRPLVWPPDPIVANNIRLVLRQLVDASHNRRKMNSEDQKAKAAPHHPHPHPHMDREDKKREHQNLTHLRSFLSERLMVADLAGIAAITRALASFRHLGGRLTALLLISKAPVARGGAFIDFTSTISSQMSAASGVSMASQASGGSIGGGSGGMGPVMVTGLLRQLIEAVGSHHDLSELQTPSPRPTGAPQNNTRDVELMPPPPIPLQFLKRPAAPAAAAPAAAAAATTTTTTADTGMSLVPYSEMMGGGGGQRASGSTTRGSSPVMTVTNDLASLEAIFADLALLCGDLARAGHEPSVVALLDAPFIAKWLSPATKMAVRGPAPRPAMTATHKGYPGTSYWHVRVQLMKLFNHVWGHCKKQTDKVEAPEPAIVLTAMAQWMSPSFAEWAEGNPQWAVGPTPANSRNHREGVEGAAVAKAIDAMREAALAACLRAIRLTNVPSAILKRTPPPIHNGERPPTILQTLVGTLRDELERLEDACGGGEPMSDMDDTATHSESMVRHCLEGLGLWASDILEPQFRQDSTEGSRRRAGAGSEKDKCRLEDLGEMVVDLDRIVGLATDHLGEERLLAEMRSHVLLLVRVLEQDATTGDGGDDMDTS